MDLPDPSVAAANPRLSLSRRLFVSGAVAALSLPVPARADDMAPPASGLAPRMVPARSLPVPVTVSPALQTYIGAPYPEGWDVTPGSASAWKALAARSVAGAAPSIAAIRQRFGLQVEARRIAGVGVFVITPKDLPPSNRDRLLLHLHGGGYALYPGEAGAGEGMLMAGYGGFKVVSVDYRMAPDHPFPAALDDAMAVWRSLLGQQNPRAMAVFGSSAGGGLALAMMLRAKAEGLPLPAAMAPGSPWVDMTWASDSVAANDFVDNVLVSNSGWVGAAAALYAAGHDLRDPLLSPIYGDFTNLPPAILTAGTRDLLLSDTVRAHRKLRRAGVEAALQVFEGQSHAQFLAPFVPETEEAFGEIARFFNAHLSA